MDIICPGNPMVLEFTKYCLVERYIRRRAIIVDNGREACNIGQPVGACFGKNARKIIVRKGVLLSKVLEWCKLGGGIIFHRVRP